MSSDLIFIIGAPRSGTTLLTKLLSQHPKIKAGPEPHILTPLAHLGVWRNVDKAPYDHIVAGLGQREFVESLPGGLEDYWQACRSYATSLYQSHMSDSGKVICLDKTPEYATIWPFLVKVFPEAKYIVLSRHPAAIFSSFANSFFGGDFLLSQQHDPLFERYIPAISGFLNSEIPRLHLRYEDLVTEPDRQMRALCDFLEIDYDPAMLEYNASSDDPGQALGDPIGLQRHTAPSNKGVGRWAEELAANTEKYDYLKGLLRRVDTEDVERFGYDPDTLWAPVELQLGAGQVTSNARHSSPLTWYKVQRKTIILLRSLIQRNSVCRRLVVRVRLICDILMREY